MRLAYFSPMPPDKTGIATYSGQLVKALARHCEVTVLTSTRDSTPVDGVRIVDFLENAGVLKSLPGFDRHLYHLGNNPWFHLEIRKAAELFPGSVCLHDTVLYYLAAGLGRGELLRELLLADPANAFANLEEIERAAVDRQLLRYPTPSRHPCARGVLDSAAHVVVHNTTSAGVVRELGYEGRVDVIPLLHYAAEFPAPTPQQALELRAQLGYAEQDFVMGAFGFIGPTKRLDKVLEALAELRGARLARRPRLLVVGEGESLDEAIARLGVGDMVRRTGFVSDEQFRQHLGAIDVLVNLRYPSHGESSASLIQAMSYGKACLVSDHGSFAEIPDGTVVKIPVGDDEVEVLARKLRELAGGGGMREAVGDAARRHIHAVHSPDAVARRLLAALSAAPGRAPSEPVNASSEPFEPAAYLRRRAEQLTRV